MVPVPFGYPEIAHARRHGPTGYEDYQSFKPWLRDEFSFRCVFCLVRERWCPLGADSFSVEHLIPQSLAPQLVCDYENLLYACSGCNSYKRERRVVLDPCTAAYGPHLRVREDGVIEGQTEEGRRLIDILGLDRDQLTQFRRQLLTLIRLLQSSTAIEAGELLRNLMGYPEDLPDLRALRPPGGNARRDGVKTSAFARRERNELPAMY